MVSRLQPAGFNRRRDGERMRSEQGGVLAFMSKYAAYWLNIIASLGCLEVVSTDIAYLRGRKPRLDGQQPDPPFSIPELNACPPGTGEACECL